MSHPAYRPSSRDLLRLGKDALARGDRAEALGCFRLLVRLEREQAVARTAELERRTQASREGVSVEVQRTDRSWRSRAPASSCRSAGCRLVPRELGFHCAYHERLLRSRMASDARKIAAVATRVYLGWTAHPERRQLELLGERALPLLSVLHWASGIEEADRVEVALRHFFRSGGVHVLERAEEHEGSAAHAGQLFAVYVAWSPRDVRSLAHFSCRRDTATDPGQRVWPSPSPQFRAVHLRSTLAPAAARALARELTQTQRDYYAATRRSAGDGG